MVVFDVAAVVLLLSWLVVVVVGVVVVGGVMVVLEPGQVSRPGTAAASQSSTARAKIIFRLSHSDQEESQEGSGASHSMI